MAEEVAEEEDGILVRSRLYSILSLSLLRLENDANSQVFLRWWYFLSLSLFISTRGQSGVVIEPCSLFLMRETAKDALLVVFVFHLLFFLFFSSFFWLDSWRLEMELKRQFLETRKIESNIEHRYSKRKSFRMAPIFQLQKKKGDTKFRSTRNQTANQSGD